MLTYIRTIYKHRYRYIHILYANKLNYIRNGRELCTKIYYEMFIKANGRNNILINQQSGQARYVIQCIYLVYMCVCVCVCLCAYTKYIFAQDTDANIMKMK